MQKLLLIYNPTAEKMQFHNKLGEIIGYYTKNNYVVTAYPTQAHRDGYIFTKNNVQNYDLIVCAGGDGTLNEIVSGMLDTGAGKLVGYIPGGSTNDFARSLNIPINIDEAVKVSCKGKSTALDVGKFNDKYFIYVAGFGLFTNVSYSTSQKMKNSLGYLAYVLEGIKALSDVQAHNVILEHDQGTIRGEFIIGLIMNSFSIGGFKNPFRSLTSLDDGLFEIILVRMPKNIIELQTIITALLNGQIMSEHIVCIQSSHIKINSEPMEWTIDGEFGGSYETVEINNLSKAVEIVVDLTDEY